MNKLVSCSSCNIRRIIDLKGCSLDNAVETLRLHLVTVLLIGYLMLLHNSLYSPCMRTSDCVAFKTYFFLSFRYLKFIEQAHGESLP